MQTMSKAVPKLRFKEFDDSWRSKILGELIEFKNGKGHEQSIDENGKYVVVNSKYVSTAGRVKKYCNTQISPLFKGEIVMVMSDVPMGKALAKCYLIDRDNTYTLNQRICALKQKNVANEFLIYLVNRNEYYLSFDSGVGQTNLKKEDVLNCPLIVPPTITEQQKIASFLSAIDEKIQQLTRKKELLEQYKKGVMQQLFPTVGGQAPKLRFRDENGKAYPKWEKTKLGEVADVKRGAASQHLNYVSDETKGVRLLRINDFLSDGAVYVENTEEMKRYTVKTNDLLIAGTGATAGIIFIVPEKFNNLSFSYNAPRIRVTNAHHTFIYYYLKSDLILRQQKRLFVGNAQPFLDTDAMRGFKINLPSMEEQQKIASYLSSLDTKIESVATQIAQIQTFKKGLLQQMFV
jgi:type I restriction enzyme S subunit